MAETMTYDPGTDTVTTENSLTPDEQDSLQVGEAMQEEQEQLPYLPHQLLGMK